MTNNDRRTVLHYSVGVGSHELVTFCYDMGTDIHHTTTNGLNCLHIAANSGHVNLCKVLIDRYKFNIHITDKNGWTVLHHSVQSGSYELIRYSADMGEDIYLTTKFGENCPHIAACHGHLDLCKILIEIDKFDMQVTDKTGCTAFHYSSKIGSYELFKCFADNTTDIHLVNYDGLNCLHVAARLGYFNLCRALIENHNFDVHVTDCEGLTALHFSVKSGGYELFKLFVENGIDVCLKTDDGKNCLHIAAEFGHLSLCKILIDKHILDVNITDSIGWEALHFSAKRGSYEFIKIFVDKGTDINLLTRDEINCLQIAAAFGHFNP